MTIEHDVPVERTVTRDRGRGCLQASRIGAALQARAEILGRSAREVSLKATGSPDSIRSIMAGSMPAADRFLMLAREVQADPYDLLEGMADGDRAVTARRDDPKQRHLDAAISDWRHAMEAISGDLPGASLIEVADIAARIVEIAIARDTTGRGRKT